MTELDREVVRRKLVLAASGSGAAADYRQSFLEAGRLGIIPSQMAADIAPSAGLREAVEAFLRGR